MCKWRLQGELKKKEHTRTQIKTSIISKKRKEKLSKFMLHYYVSNKNALCAERIRIRNSKKKKTFKKYSPITSTVNNQQILSNTQFLAKVCHLLQLFQFQLFFSSKFLQYQLYGNRYVK